VEVEKENPNYYSIITADVRYDKRLTSTQKLLYSEIVALSNKYGYCYANNKYFAGLYDVKPNYISITINKLISLGYIKSVIDKEKGNNRKLYIVEPKKQIETIEISNTDKKDDTKVIDLYNKSDIPTTQKLDTYITREIDLYNKSDIPILQKLDTYITKVIDINIKHNNKQNIKENIENKFSKKTPNLPKTSNTINTPYKKENIKFYENIINTYNSIEGRPAVRGFKVWAKNCDYWLKSNDNPDGYCEDDIVRSIFHILLCKKKWEGQTSLELHFRQKDSKGNPIDRIGEALLMQVPNLEETGYLKGSHIEAHQIYNERYRND